MANGSGTITSTDVTGVTVTCVPSVIVTSYAGAHGTITPSGAQTVGYGDTRALTIAADTGYEIDTVTGSGGAGGDHLRDGADHRGLHPDRDLQGEDLHAVLRGRRVERFFSTRIAVLNPTETATTVTLTLLGSNGQRTRSRALPARQRHDVHAGQHRRSPRHGLLQHRRSRSTHRRGSPGDVGCDRLRQLA